MLMLAQQQDQSLSCPRVRISASADQGTNDGQETCRPVGRVHGAHDGQQACSPQRLRVQLLADAWGVEPCRQHLRPAQAASSDALVTPSRFDPDSGVATAAQQLPTPAAHLLSCTLLERRLPDQRSPAAAREQRGGGVCARLPAHLAHAAAHALQRLLAPVRDAAAVQQVRADRVGAGPRVAADVSQVVAHERRQPVPQSHVEPAQGRGNPIAWI